MKRSRYLDLMQMALAAYSQEHILRYFNDVKTNGLKEHGFPRLTANMGILLAHGRRNDLKELFTEMMDFCCSVIPKTRKAANDFSVKEIICALEEVEKSGLYPPEKLEQWKDDLRHIDPYTCYDVYAKSKEDTVYNWAAFTMLSEFMRQKAGLSGEYGEFIDLQAYSQLRHLDENKMYKDPGCPMVYDLVTRGLFAHLLFEGYEGKYKKDWEEALETSAKPTPYLQSVSGEIPYGGRSNQFLHNEAHYALMSEYYAGVFAKKGDMVTAGMYKARVCRALENIELYLSGTPVYHVKNRFPTATEYGCEDYAYFDKYMITVASFLYVAYRMCNESIEEGSLDDLAGMSYQTSSDFHKVFLRGGGYYAEYDWNADFLYDCSGLGRLHKKGIPSELCLSTPCPEKSHYKVDMEAPALLCIAPGICHDGEWIYAVNKEVEHIVLSHRAWEEKSFLAVKTLFPAGEEVETNFLLSEKGLEITLTGKGPLRCLLPAFHFNGEEYTQIRSSESKLSITYKGACCCYTVENGSIKDLQRPARNRNGHYESFAAEGKEKLIIRITLEKL